MDSTPAEPHPERSIYFGKNRQSISGLYICLHRHYSIHIIMNRFSPVCRHSTRISYINNSFIQYMGSAIRAATITRRSCSARIVLSGRHPPRVSRSLNCWSRSAYPPQGYLCPVTSKFPQFRNFYNSIYFLLLSPVINIFLFLLPILRINERGEKKKEESPNSRLPEVELVAIEAQVINNNARLIPTTTTPP